MIRRRYRRLLKVCHRRGYFPPPLRRVPLITSRYLLTCRVIGKPGILFGGYEGTRIIFEP